MKMTRAIEAAQKAFNEAVKAFNEAVKSAEDESEQKLRKTKENKRKKRAAIMAAMQGDFERLSLLRQVYHEAPDDVFELIVSKCCQFDKYGWGLGGFNAFRLANKRLKQVAESCTLPLNTSEPDEQ